jgi:hypothetical protein
MTTFQAIMFGVMLALTPSLVALAFFLWREWMIARNEDAGRCRPVSDYDRLQPILTKINQGSSVNGRPAPAQRPSVAERGHRASITRQVQIRALVAQ